MTNLNDFSKEYLWEQLEAVEDERNKLLNICNELYDYFNNMPMLNDEEEYYISKLEKLTGR